MPLPRGKITFLKGKTCPPKKAVFQISNNTRAVCMMQSQKSIFRTQRKQPGSAERKTFVL